MSNLPHHPLYSATGSSSTSSQFNTPLSHPRAHDKVTKSDHKRLKDTRKSAIISPYTIKNRNNPQGVSEKRKKQDVW
jgi:hypothetical protein